MSILVSQFGNFFTGIIDAITTFFDALGYVFGAIIDSILDPIWMLLYYTFVGIAQIANFCELVFKKVAGLDTIYVGGEAFGGAQQIGSQGAGSTGGLVMAFLGNDTVYKTLIAIIIFSVVLLFLTTIIAIIKAEFSLDVKTSAKGPIIGRALKALVMFFIVPVVTVIGIYLTNIITLSVNQLLSGTTSTGIVNNCFKCAAYNANRGRNQSIVEEYYKTGLRDPDSKAVLGWTPDDVDAAFVKTLSADAVDMPLITANNGQDELNGSGLLQAGLQAASVIMGPASGIIGAFNLVFNTIGDWTAFSANIHTMMMPMPTAGFEISFYNYYQVRYFYSMSSFDYIIGIGTALVMSWILLSTCLALIKRVFEITMLMLLAPPMIALAPLDNGQAQKKWQGEMLKRVIATIGPVFAFNMYFLLVPLFSSISLFAPIMSVSNSLSIGAAQTGMPFLAAVGVAIVAYDLFMQLIIVIVGLSIVKQASAMISSLLGIEDLVKSGMDTSKKAVATAASVASMAFGGAGLAVKGVSAAMKAGGKMMAKKRAAKRVNDAKSSQLKENTATAENEMNAADKEVKQQEAAVEAADKEIDAIQHTTYTDPAKYQADMDAAQQKKKDAQAALSKATEKRDHKSDAYQAAKNKEDMYTSGATEKQMHKAQRDEIAASFRDDSIKQAEETYNKSKKTKKDQQAYDDAVAAANLDYKKSTSGAFGGFMASAGDKLSGLGKKISRSSLGEGFAQEFGKNATGTSIFAGAKHMDKNANSMWRMVLDNWVGIMGGKEDGAGLIVRRALEKTERERFFYSGKENKQLELKREQGLLMQERAASEANIQKSKDKEADKKLLRQMLQDDGKSGKDLEEAFLNALNRHEQGKKVPGFEEYKRRSDERAKKDMTKKAVEEKIMAHQIDVQAAQQIQKAENVKLNAERVTQNSAWESKPIPIDPESINKLKEKIEEAFKTALTEAQKKQLNAGQQSINKGELTAKQFETLTKLVEQILGKIK